MFLKNLTKKKQHHNKVLINKNTMVNEDKNFSSNEGIEKFETNILDEVKQYLEKGEMQESEKYFLNGIIRKYKPKKLLEVGVSAGGSSIIMLNAIKEYDARLYSVDYSKKYYRDNTKETGYLVQENVPHLANKYKLYTGNIAANFMEEIGGDIDLCLLDTVHSIPGELLDILMILPFMKKDGIIVLHDTSYHCFKNTAYSNGILFSVIKANKLQPLMNEDSIPLPNIGAFQLMNDTMQYASDIFLSLNLPWQYLPSDACIQEAIKLYLKYYKEKDIKILEKIFLYNKKICENKIKYKGINVACKKYKKYPKWLIYFLCWFVVKKINRNKMRKKYI
ncbi:MAG: class I SAM-dependent methyltransferase [Rickettsiales bacterium]|jgi:predicted O-methyltransferase YrrM|nr:class I SAM-dependent methyltransferase [Rickettsiales bacterium]